MYNNKLAPYITLIINILSSYYVKVQILRLYQVSLLQIRAGNRTYK